MTMNQQILSGLNTLQYYVDNENFILTSQLTGICGNLLDIMGNNNNPLPELKEAFKLWPETSGNTRFPVEGKHDEYFRYDSKWHPHNPYSEKRKRLLVWLIDYFKEKINAEHHPTSG